MTSGLRRRLFWRTVFAANAVVRRLPVARKPSYIHDRWLWFSRDTWRSLVDTYEPAVASALQTYLHPGGTFLDVGAHHGYWSLYGASLVGPRGIVVALEPSEAFLALGRNVSRRVRALRIGASDADGEREFFGQSTHGSFVRDVTLFNAGNAKQAVLPHRVQMRRLDTLVSDGLRPSVVKIDVEGFEWRVLTGARHLLRDVRPVFIVEIHPPQLALSGGSSEAVMQLLSDANYTVTKIDAWSQDDNSIRTVLAVPNNARPLA